MGDFEDALATAETTTELHFRFGQDGHLDARIGKFRALRELQLRDVPPDCVLPEELLGLPALEELGLSGADDKLVMPALVEKLAIERLTVWDLHASQLPPLPKLKRLAIVVQDPESEVPILAERFSHLTELRIWGSHREESVLPVDIERFSRLEVLELISCGVRTLPDAIAKLHALRTFEIRGCPMDQFPEVLTRMPALERIHIGEPIAGLPATLGNMQALRELRLGHALNKGAMLSKWDDIKTMKALPKVLGELENLETLDIDCCGVFDVEPLRSLKKLKSLSMSWSAVTTVEPLGELTELEELSIEHADRVRDLSPLAKCTKLRSLNISNTKPKSLDFLRALPRLQKLNVEGIEAKRIDAIYDLEVELEADDEVKARYAARAELRAMPSIASIALALGQRDLASVEAACDQLATWAAAASTRDENALVAALGIKSVYDDEHDDDDDDDDDDEDDDEDDDDEDEGDDDDGVMRSLPALDTALDRYLAQLSAGVLARLFGVTFHAVGDNFPAALRIANELVSRGDDAAQCTLVDGFIAACEHYDAGHREHGYTVHDVLLDEVFPLLGGPALAKLLAWCSTDALDDEQGDGMSRLFAPALARATGDARASVLATLEKAATSMLEYRRGPARVEKLLASCAAPQVQGELAAIRARIDAQLAAQTAKADREKRLEAPATAAAALDELTGLADRELREYQGSLWRTNNATTLPSHARRLLVQLWQRLGHEGGLSDAILTFASYVPLDELRADLDALTAVGSARGKLVRGAVMSGVEKDAPKPQLDKLRALATELDGIAPAVAESMEVRALLFGGAARFEDEKFKRGIALLAAVPAYTPPDDGEEDQSSELAAMVATLAECEDFEPLQELARSLHKLNLSGRSLERVLAQLVAVCMVSSDPEGLQAILPLVPHEISWDILAFNLACKYARESDREPTFKFTKRALELGKSPDQFLSDTDFEEFAEDKEFVALLDAHR